MLDELMDFKYQKHQDRNANTLWGKIIKYSKSIINAYSLLSHEL